MSDEDAADIWEMITIRFDFPASLPTDEEVKIFDAYKKGDEDYQPFITHDDLKKELELA